MSCRAGFQILNNVQNAAQVAGDTNRFTPLPLSFESPLLSSSLFASVCILLSFKVTQRGRLNLGDLSTVLLSRAKCPSRASVEAFSSFFCSKTTRQGVLNPAFPPVAQIKSGDIITIECVTWSCPYGKDSTFSFHKEASQSLHTPPVSYHEWRKQQLPSTLYRLSRPM